ncbi:GNAT family N-acetyltransferase [Streptomyces sp. NPDC006879]|uniref:GNAT family N-acetyltransferase n=1 Tax=Streptomyces sp. NPDC006879 TaxID=3364767 RepID=UPI00369105C9
MEITAGGRFEVRITPTDVGRRVSVRRLNPDREGTERFTDTVGVLASWNEGVLLITARDGRIARIAESDLVAGKVVPPAPARRRGPAAGFRELAQVGARAWQPVESEPLGEWTLRAAGGFTRRANSVLPLGEPGTPLDDALARVTSWYAERGLPAYLQAATGAEGTQEVLCAELTARGWVREVSAGVRIGALAPVGDQAADVGHQVRLSRDYDRAWARRYQRVASLGPHVRQVLTAGPSVWFATVAGADADGPAAAIGRCVVDGRWAGFMAVETDPQARRRGLATAVMATLARQALAEGASAAWLQVEEDNEGALALYERMGFSLHHSYHHYRGPR